MKSSTAYWFIPFPLFLCVVFLVVSESKQNKGKGASWRGERAPICEEVLSFLRIEGKGRDKEGRDDRQRRVPSSLRLVVFLRLLVSCLLSSVQYPSRKLKWPPCCLSSLTSLSLLSFCFRLTEKAQDRYDKAVEGKAEGDSLRLDLAVLHHVPLLGLSLLLFSLLFSFS